MASFAVSSGVRGSLSRAARQPVCARAFQAFRTLFLAPNHEIVASPHRPSFAAGLPRNSSVATRHPLLLPSVHSPSFRRRLSFTNIFEGDDSRTVVESYNPHGFVVNGVLMQGAVILLQKTQLVWNVRSVEEITWESLAVLQVLKQKPDLCIIGTGPRIERLSDELRKGMMQAGIGIEVMDTVNALATFNVLNEEGRVVVGAFLPVDPLEEQVKTLQEALSKQPEPAAKQSEPAPRVRGAPSLPGDGEGVRT